MYVSDGSPEGRRQVAAAYGQSYPGTNHGPAGEWEQIAGGGPGAFQEWRRSIPIQSAPVYQKGGPTDPCGTGSTGWTAPDNIQVDIERTTTTIREARFPVAGTAGAAAVMHNHTQVLPIMTENWTSDDHTSFYEDLAERLWAIHQNPHYSGSVTLVGVQDWGAMIDMGVRASFTHQMGPAGGPDELRRFWSIIQGVEIDFVGNTVALEFDSANPLKDLSLRVYEDLGVGQQTIVDRMGRKLQSIETYARCEAGANRVVSLAPGAICASAVRGGTRPLPLASTHRAQTQREACPRCSPSSRRAWRTHPTSRHD